MRLLMLVIFAVGIVGGISACTGPYSGYVEPPTPQPEGVVYGPPTPGTVFPSNGTVTAGE